ncbi:hypothetical protein EMGBD1_04190 [Anaerolineaceae bacterium]|nr:hypothetical protein EMGBD1_04190 [Anaerolineaceae bacterium]
MARDPILEGLPYERERELEELLDEITKGCSTDWNHFTNRITEVFAQDSVGLLSNSLCSRWIINSRETSSNKFQSM